MHLARIILWIVIPLLPLCTRADASPTPTAQEAHR